MAVAQAAGSIVAAAPPKPWWRGRTGLVLAVAVAMVVAFFGWKSQAPFQGILVAAAPETIPPELVEQLDDGGRMIIPIGAQLGARGPMQKLLRVTRHGTQIEQEELLPVNFVPMVAGTEL